MASYSEFTVGDAGLTAHAAPNDGKPHLASKLIVADGHVSFVNLKGELFSTRVGSGRWFYGRNWGRHLSVVKDAIALGVIPKKGNIDKVIAIEADLRAKKEAAYHARSAVEHMQSAGVPLTSAQRKALLRMTKAAAVAINKRRGSAKRA